LSPVEANTEESPRVSPVENLSGWLEDREAKREKPAEEPAPAEPTAEVPVEAPVEPAGDWWETGLADANHGFLKGRKGPEVEKAFRHVETAKQTAERERNELQREIEAIKREREAEAAARKVAAENKPSQPPVDVDAEIEAKLIENPREGIRLIRERTLAEARKLAEEVEQKFRNENEQAEYNRQVKQAGEQAYDKTRELVNNDPKFDKRMRSVYVEVTDKNSPYYGDGYNAFRPDVMAKVYEELYEVSASPAQIVVKPTPEIPTPPGAKKPSAANLAEPSSSPLTRERIDAARTFAAIGGVDPKALVARQERRKERTRG
jgi:hypothetical protein